MCKKVKSPEDLKLENLQPFAWDCVFFKTIF